MMEDLVNNADGINPGPEGAQMAPLSQAVTIRLLKDIVSHLKVDNRELHSGFLELGHGTRAALQSVIFLNEHRKGDDRKFHVMDWAEILSMTIDLDTSDFETVAEVNGELCNAEDLVDPHGPDPYNLRAHQEVAPRAGGGETLGVIQAMYDYLGKQRPVFGTQRYRHENLAMIIQEVAIKLLPGAKFFEKKNSERF